MKKYEKLKKYFEEKTTVSGLRGSNRNAIERILDDGIARTGESSIRRGGWKSKAIWTEAVSNILTRFNIEHICGNDAPRGGANGEFVQVTSKAFLRDMKKEKIEREIRRAADIKIEEYLAVKEKEGWKSWKQNHREEWKDALSKHRSYEAYTICHGKFMEEWKKEKTAIIKNLKAS